MRISKGPHQGLPWWMMEYLGKPEYGKHVHPTDVFIGKYAGWVAVGPNEAHAIVSWGFEVVYTETRKPLFFCDPAAAKDARVGERIAQQEAQLDALPEL